MYTVYTDGGARGNPGPAGAGAAIFDTDMKLVGEVSEFLGAQTNNWAEYEAIVLGLEKLLDISGGNVEVVVRLDSQLAQRQLTGEYKVKDAELYKQYLKVQNLLPKFTKVSFEHVRREQNKEADALANKAMDRGAE
ncbi:MAG: ribonuclease HI family protein [Patescibacteria group bacterium UBA2103]